ncbi:glycoside hydrolase family 19 protein [Vreelandella indica]|uniref:glycoside hydrolase family 19 protein n=1 Tax=Vreelandella indica TaxID=3126500 RepID=UPI00300E5F56
MQLNHDNSGFLVGERLSAEDVTGRLDAIRDELRALRKDIGGQSVGGRGAPVANKPTEANSSPAPRQAKTEAATPRHDEIVVRVDQEKPPAVAATSQQRDLGQYVYSQAVTPGSPANQAPFNLNTASTASPSISVGSNAAAATPSKDIGGQSVGGRDASGRFVPKDGGSAAANAQDEEDSNGLLMKSINGLGDRMAGAAREIGAGSEEADPTVKAFNEVAQPLSRGFGKIMGDGSDRKQERWYRRFWLMMRGTRREDREEGKQQRRILKNIERKPTGGDSGSMLWRGIMLLLAPITGMLSLLGGLPIALAGAVIAGLKGLLTALGMGKIARRMTIPGSGRSTSQRGGSARGGTARSAAGVGASQRQQGGGSRLGGAPAASGGSGAGRLLKGGMRKIPGIGALLGLGFMASDVAASEGSDATRAEKDTMTGRAVGGGLGGIAGMAGGAAAGAAVGSVVPVVGTVVGGLIGAIAGSYFGGNAGETIGEEVGGWVTDLRQSNLVSSLAQRWEYATTFMSSLWSQTSEGVAARWNVATDAFQGLWDSSTAKFNSTWESLSGSLAERWASVTDEMKGVWSGAVSIAAEGWSTLTDAMGGVNDWVAEKTGVDIGQATRDAGEWVSDRAVESTEWVAGRAEAAADRVEGATSWLGSKISAGASWVGEKSGVSTAVNAVRNAHNEASATPALTQAMAEAGITDPNEQAAFMGQMHHESGGFRTMEESFNYSSADRIMAVSRTARNQGPEAVEAAMAQGPEAIAELMYGGRMGNTEPGDGHRYRGRGFTQLTGKDNYTAASESLGIDLVNNPDMAADPEVAAKVATWYWQNREGLSEAAQSGDTREVTRLINGGDNGLADREAQTSRYLAAAEAGEFTPSSVSEPPNNNVAARQSTPEATATVSTDHLRAMGLSARAPALGSASPQSASIPPLRVPPVGEAPTVSVPLSSSGERTNGQQASRAPQDVSRDLGDRRIAHIVTGSYSGMG